MKLKLMLLLMLCSSVVYGYEIGVGSGTAFPVSTDTAHVILTNNDKATAGYANDVKQAIVAIEKFLLAEPWFVLSNVGIFTSVPAERLHVVGNQIISGTLCVGTTIPKDTLYVVGTSSITGAVKLGSTLTMNAGNIALGGNTLTTTNATKISNLNADYVDGLHFVSSYTAWIPIPANGIDAIKDFAAGITVGNAFATFQSMPVGTDWTILAYASTTTATSVTIRMIKNSANSTGSVQNILFNWFAVGQ